MTSSIEAVLEAHGGLYNKVGTNVLFFFGLTQKVHNFERNMVKSLWSSLKSGGLRSHCETLTELW